MKIISHRGYWKTASEKNTVLAFERSFSLGFGTETDIRDYDGKLVISHDIATKDCILLDDFFEIYNKYDINLPLALNIKSDGLIDLLTACLKKHNITNYFVFDMSIPQHIQYVKSKVPSFIRHSEYEPNPQASLLYENSTGVWIDCFNGEWFDENVLSNHLDNGKIVCIVSPDLHRREHKIFWRKLSKMKNIIDNENLILCTDFPEEARGFFHDKN
jgi:hypothetical protein